MKKFSYMVKMVFLEKTAYIKALWFDSLTTFVSIFIYYCLWNIVYKGRNEMADYTFREIVTYVILSRTLAIQFSAGVNQQFALWIYDGSIGMEMLRPVRLFTNLFAKRVGEFLFYVIFKALPIMIISFAILRGSGPMSSLHLLLFLVSVSISIIIMFYIEVLVGMGSFYTLTHYALSFAKTAVLDLLSGAIVPVFLFPGPLEDVVNAMPFVGMVSIPVNIFLGKYTIRECLGYLCLQCFWGLIMGAISHLCYRKVIKKVIVQGG